MANEGAVDRPGAARPWQLVFLVALGVAPPVLAAPPANDDRANAQAALPRYVPRGMAMNILPARPMVQSTKAGLNYR